MRHTQRFFLAAALMVPLWAGAQLPDDETPTAPDDWPKRCAEMGSFHYGCDGPSVPDNPPTDDDWYDDVYFQPAGLPKVPKVQPGESGDWLDYFIRPAGAQITYKAADMQTGAAAGVTGATRTEARDPRMSWYCGVSGAAGGSACNPVDSQHSDITDIQGAIAAALTTKGGDLTPAEVIAAIDTVRHKGYTNSVLEGSACTSLSSTLSGTNRTIQIPSGWTPDDGFDTALDGNGDFVATGATFVEVVEAEDVTTSQPMGPCIFFESATSGQPFEMSESEGTEEEYEFGSTGIGGMASTIVSYLNDVALPLVLTIVAAGVLILAFLAFYKRGFNLY